MITVLMHKLAMGGYALYVWPAFGVSVLVLAYNGCKAYFQYRALLKALRKSSKTVVHAPTS